MVNALTTVTSYYNGVAHHTTIKPGKGVEFQEDGRVEKLTISGHASVLTLYKCDSIQSVIAPQVDKIRFVKCHKLATADIRGSKTVEIKQCPLTVIDVPNADVIRLRDMGECLLKAPSAQRVYGHDFSQVNTSSVPAGCKIEVADA